MATTTHLTKEGFQKLEEELYELKFTKLPAVLERLKDAIAQWDISENAEYDTAMSEKELIEARISEIEHIMQHVEIIESTAGWVEIRYGSVVVLKDEKWKKTTWTVVGSGEVDVLEGTISFQSPLGHALRGKKTGDVVTVRAPQKKYSVTIVEVK